MEVNPLWTSRRVGGSLRLRGAERVKVGSEALG